jgi:hypothetical protein
VVVWLPFSGFGILAEILWLVGVTELAGSWPFTAGVTVLGARTQRISA